MVLIYIVVLRTGPMSNAHIFKSSHLVDSDQKQIECAEAWAVPLKRLHFLIGLGQANWLDNQLMTFAKAKMVDAPCIYIYRYSNMNAARNMGPMSVSVIVER